MGKPIYVLAGQSNAGNIADDVLEALTNKYGANGFVLVEVRDAGAPLTFKRSLQDWAVSGELQKDLIDKTVAALNANPTSEIAGVFWVQGEADTSDIARANEYEDRFNALIADYKSAVDQATGNRDTGINSATVVISQLSTNAPKSTSRSQWNDIIDAQNSAAENSEAIDIVNPDAIAAQFGFTQESMFRDSLHYSDAFSQFLAEAMLRAVSDGGSKPGKSMVYGTSGNDTLAGGAGADIMMGGMGNDNYYSNNGGDQIVEYKNQGVDQVIATTSFSLRFHSQFIENLTLIGAEDINGTGNRLSNILTGNSGDNSLNGARGNDTLYGNGGNDTFRDGWGTNKMYGGAGDDTYIIKALNNRIIEFADQGNDTVISSIKFSLYARGENLENLTLTGADDIYGLGNAQDNRITGNSGDNYLNGGRGDDILTGGGGRDTLRGGTGADTFVFNAGGIIEFDGSNQAELDAILDFKVGVDLIQFGAGVAQSLSDLRMWDDPVNNQFVIKIIGTDMRIALQGDYLESDLFDSGNFLFS